MVEWCVSRDVDAPTSRRGQVQVRGANPRFRGRVPSGLQKSPLKKLQLRNMGCSLFIQTVNDSLP